MVIPDPTPPLAWVNPFVDVDEGDWFYDDADIANYGRDAIEAFFKAGYVSGRPNGGFDPKGYATRAEFAAMAHRVFDTVT